MSLFSQQRIWLRIVGMALGTLASAFAVLCVIFGLQVRNAYNDKIFEVSEAPAAVYGVVLGAAIKPDTLEPSDLLRDRLDTAIELLKKRTIMGVVITGDDGKWKSDEISSMLNYLHSQNVPDDVIVVDGGAYRTFDSCQNMSRRGFNNIVLVTQRFHMSRALYLCNELGVQATGALADRHWYVKGVWFWLRDFLASPFAYLDVRGFEIIQKGPTV